MKMIRLAKEQWIWVSARFALGWVFLWAFLDKTFGLGYSTSPERAWISGGSPTSGFLTFATKGPLSDFYQGLSGNLAVDVLFMAALVGVGVALILGIGLKIAGYVGSLLMLLMWSAMLPPETNPIIDNHIIYIILLLGISIVKPGKWLGLGKWWSETKLVKRLPILE